MTTTGIPTALQEKNEQDFAEVTQRIQDALTRIKDDKKLKATQDVLAKLANCSRGTLNNRKWPLDQLRAIKATRKDSVSVADSLSKDESNDKNRIDSYKQKLDDSREEVLVWQTRHSDATRQLIQAQHLNRVLQSRLEAAENEISKLRSLHTSKVVKMPPKRLE